VASAYRGIASAVGRTHQATCRGSHRTSGKQEGQVYDVQAALTEGVSEVELRVASIRGSGVADSAESATSAAQSVRITPATGASQSWIALRMASFIAATSRIAPASPHVALVARVILRMIPAPVRAGSRGRPVEGAPRAR
jgi:hypothetical protein